MNSLNHEKSPYLLQHKDNPVWWRPWGQDALKAAQEQNKPIFLSIGYATCHWCHVMAHESFESQDVADILNAHFIAIKLDREERPDIDDIYMAAVLAINQHGGWPLSVWLFPDGRPFFGGTYFPKDHFIDLLNRIHQTWSSKPELVERDANHLTDYLKKSRQKQNPPHAVDPVKAENIFASFVDDHRGRFDPHYGGFGRSPKFPQTMNLMALLRLEETAMVEKTLDGMMTGGMHDQLMGGFHRYSVDQEWIVPHFEKMLYDQAWLTLTYLEGAVALKKPIYANVARSCLDYVLREMTSPEGGFYSAQDADSLDPHTQEMEEGFFATFPYHEIQSAVTELEFKALEQTFLLTPEGNFEGQNILVLSPLSTGATSPELTSALLKLKHLRLTKPQPLTDDKILTAWNGWMISAMVKGYQVLGEEKYLIAAQNAAAFILEKLWNAKTCELFLRIRDGDIKGRALSDDFTAMILAFLDLYEATSDPKWIDHAVLFQQTLDDVFWDTESAGYFRDDGKDPTVLVRLKEDHDGVRPNANSLAVMNLLRLYHMTTKAEYKTRAEQVLGIYFEQLESYPMAMPYLLLGLDFYLAPVVELGIGAKVQTVDRDRMKDRIWHTFAPHTVVTQGLDASGFSICQEGVCHPPTADPQLAWETYLQVLETYSKS